jgi:hypothetical protein
MGPKRKPRRKTAFVPRAFFRVALTGVGVVPLCATAGLAGLAGLGPGCNANPSLNLSVAAQCFCDGSMGDIVSSTTCCEVFHPDAATDAHHVDSVADHAFSDVKDAEAADVRLSVADAGFADVTDAGG